jgi:hypothetical protein
MKKDTTILFNQDPIQLINEMLFHSLHPFIFEFLVLGGMLRCGLPGTLLSASYDIQTMIKLYEIPWPPICPFILLCMMRPLSPAS